MSSTVNVKGMESQETGIQSRLDKLLSEVKKVSHELLGGGSLGSGDSAGLLEITTTRQILEKIEYSLEGITRDMRDFKGELRSLTETTSDIKQNGCGKHNSESGYEPVDILPNPNEVQEEEDKISKEFEKMREQIKLASTGTCGSVAQENENLDDVNAKYYSFVLELRNYLDVSLSHDCCSRWELIFFGPCPHPIRGRTRHRVVITSKRQDMSMQGSVSFAIGVEKLQLCFEFSGMRPQQNQMGISIRPSDVDNGFKDASRSKRRKNMDVDRTVLIIKYGDLVARGSLVQEGNVVVTVLEVGLLKREANVGKVSLEAVQKALPPPRLPSHDFFLKLFKPGCPSFREFEGIISYQLESTDLRLVLALRNKPKFPVDVSFVIGFIPSDTAVNTNLLTLFFQKDSLNAAYNRKWGSTNSGEVTAATWNVKAVARMTQDKKSATDTTALELELVVCTV